VTGTGPRPGAVVYAKDPTAVSEFYQRVAGLGVEDADQDFVMLGGSHLQVAVVRIPDHLAETIEIAVPAARREDTAIKLVIPVASLAEAREAAESAGGVIDPPDREWSFAGCLRCDGHDPEGNVIQAVQES
jgi:predicted enzyme related to lactoylglutathione lyase